MDRTAEFVALSGRSFRRGRDRRTNSLLDQVTRIRTMIIKAKTSLIKDGHDYLDTYGCIPGESTMTNEKRDALDQQVENFINFCNDRKQQLRSEIQASGGSQQMLEYQGAVMEIMTRALNDFMSYYTHLRSTRMSRNLEKQKYDRIESASGRISPTKEYESLCIESINLETLASQVEQETSLKAETLTPKSSFTLDDFKEQSILAAEHHTSIGPDEIQALALENSQIHEELITLDDEIRLIGKKVVQISRLQELFTEKVIEQEMELNSLHEAAIKSSENVREGNDLIRDAIMKNASTRVLILFYIITLGFTILFLDWYNP